jgi:putative mRNA 3-end processing factor
VAGVDVTLSDGIEIELATGERFVADASEPDGDLVFVSHAHGDHLYDAPPGTVLCSDLTARLAARRREDVPLEYRTDHPRVELLPSGHVPGSRAALVDDGERRFLYTGDVSTRDRFWLAGFEPVAADVLVVESTYGEPAYEFPAQDVLEDRIVSWFDEMQGTPLVCFGYTLGRAQEVQALVNRSARGDRGELYVTDAVRSINEVVEDACDVSFGATRYDRGTDLGGDDVLVLPSQTSRLDFVADIAEETGAVTAGFSGWAVDESYRFRAGLDAAFTLSDHCDYPELLDLVAAVDPEVVYTQHGFADELATAVRSELGIRAQALKRDQSTLGDF